MAEIIDFWAMLLGIVFWIVVVILIKPKWGEKFKKSDGTHFTRKEWFYVLGGVFVAMIPLSFLKASTEHQPSANTTSESKTTPKETMLVIPTANLSPERQNFVNHYWPQIKAACHGLDKYAEDLTFEGIQDNYDTDFVFKVADNPKNSTLASYVAGGHRCFFGVSQNGQALSISKMACKSLCLDKDIQQSGDLEIPLTNLKNTETSEYTTLSEARAFATDTLAVLEEAESSLRDGIKLGDDLGITRYVQKPLRDELTKWPAFLKMKDDDQRRHFTRCQDAMLALNGLSYSAARQATVENLKTVRKHEASYIKEKQACIKAINTSDAQIKAAIAAEDAELKRKFGGRECLTVYDFDKATNQLITLPKPSHCKKP